VAAAAAERAAREASREGAWARDGPETEALKTAKVALAEILGGMDEVRLQERHEAAELQREIEAAQAERAVLQRLAEQPPPAKSFGASFWRLVKVARGGEDPCGHPALEGRVR